MASSISLPMVGCLALACRCDQRASFGTQNTFSARYSSGSSAAAGSSASKRRALGLEGVRNVLEKDQAERDMLVVRRLEVLAQLVGSEEELRLEAKVGSAPVALLRLVRLGVVGVAGSVLWVSPRHVLPRAVVGPTYKQQRDAPSRSD